MRVGGEEVDVFENGERPQCLIDCEMAVNRFLSVLLWKIKAVGVASGSRNAYLCQSFYM